LQINTEYKYQFTRKAIKRYPLLHAKEILLYVHKNIKHGRCACEQHYLSFWKKYIQFQYMPHCIEKF